MMISWPVMYEADSEARNAMAASDFVRATWTADGSMFARNDFVFGGRRGFDPARGNGVHSDSLSRNFEGETARHSYHAGFRRTIGGFARIADGQGR